MNKERAALIPRPGTGAVSFYWKRWSLRPQCPSAPSLRRFISGSFLTSAEPAPLLRLRPLRPPLPFLRRRGASILPAGDRQSGSRCAPFLRRLSLPCGQPASASHRLPVRAAAHAPSLRRFSFPSVSAELISGRFPSSPLRASNPSGDRGERYARPARHGSVPPPSTARIQPPQAPAEPAAFRLRLCAGLCRPSLSFAPAPSSARSRSAWVPTLRRLRISPLAPLSPDVLCRLRFSGLLAAPALASGCSVPLRGTASAGSGRTPFVLTPPLRPAQAQARFGSASGQPARSLPPAAGVPQAPQPASVVRSPGRLPLRLDSRRAPINLPVRSRPRPALRGLRSRPAASVPGQIDLRAHYRFLPGNLLRLRPSSAPAAAPATIARRACFPSAPGGLRLRRLPSSALFGMRPLSVRPHGFRLRPSRLRRLRRNDLRLKFDPARPTGLPLCSAAFRCAALRRGAPTSRFRVGRSCVSAPFRFAPGKPGPPCSATCAACPCVPRAPSGAPAAAHDLRSSPMRQGLRAFGRVLLFRAEGFGREYAAMPCVVLLIGCTGIAAFLITAFTSPAS